jgi:hypothetical protein
MAMPEGQPNIQRSSQGARGETALLRPGQADGGIPGLHPAAEALVAREIPHRLIDQQLQGYTREGIQLSPTGREFNPVRTLEALKGLIGKRAIAIDAGGKKIAAEAVEVVKDGKLQRIGRAVPKRSKNGAGYVAYMEGVSKNVNGGEGYAVGFSFAGPVDQENGTRPKVYTNVPVMQDDMAPYEGDFAKIFPNAEKTDGGNDARAALVAAVIEATREDPDVEQVALVIDGGGLGGGIWKDGELKDAEPGHPSVIKELNPGQTSPCGQKGSPNPEAPCVERVAGSGAGIEDLHYQLTHETKLDPNTENQIPLEGEEIEQKFLEGDPLATALIDNATILTATAALGIVKAAHSGDKEDYVADARKTVFVGHGGFFRYAGVRERFEKILKERIGTAPKVLYTDDITKDTTGNAGADGAAILALTAPQRAKAA